MSTETDEDLMKRICRGDADAYEALYLRWSGRVFDFLVRRTGARAEAEEALQETWLRVYRHSKRYNPMYPFPRWLFGIAVNAGRDAWRPEPQVFHLEPPPTHDPDTRDRLVRALHGLDPGDRRLFLLTVEGFTSQEVGEMMQISPGAVRTRLCRARAALRQSLGGDHG